MSARLRILLFVLAALGLPVCGVLWFTLPRSPARVHDPAYHFEVARVTHGTNHVLELGESSLRRLKLRGAVPSQEQAFTKTTPTPVSLLWVAYTHEGELVRIYPSGMPGPDLNSFEVWAPGLDGESIILRPLGGSYNPVLGLYVTILALPAGVTNVSECELRLSTGRRLATLQVW